MYPIKYINRRYDVQIIPGQVRARGLRSRTHVTEHFPEPIFKVFETESVTVRDSFQNYHLIYSTALAIQIPRIDSSDVQDLRPRTRVAELFLDPLSLS